MVPFIWNIADVFGTIIESREMELVSGFTGISQDKDSLCLRPEIGWAVYEKGNQSKNLSR